MSPDVSPSMLIDESIVQEHVKDEEEEEMHWKAEAESVHDELTGEELPPELVKCGRAEECAFMESWGVWQEVPVSECWQRTGRKPTGTRWVDVNKGDVENPDVRCRLVAQEVNTYKDDDFFAATPPLEALRLLLSHVATEQKGSGGRNIMILDAKKAHLHAYAEREIYVELPPERRRPGVCGRLIRSLYGTRDAPALWERFAASQLEDLGFIRGSASPCVFRHASRDLVVLIHGDDFVFAGAAADLVWVHKELEQRILLKKVGTLGSDSGDVQEIRILNRVLRWTEEGIAYEADPRHADILVQALGSDPSSRATPGAKPASSAVLGLDPLPWDSARLYRACAARANYLAMDRVDVSFAAKELCRRMSAPTWSVMEALRRLVQYLAGVPRLVWFFGWQAEAGIHVYADTDYAGCQATRRSTSGGMLFRGGHVIKHWSTTQKHVTLS